MEKKGAMELSIGTIVILVLAMAMLILGLVLVKSIFSGAKYNIDTINDKVKDEINKLFVEDKRMVVYLANQKAEMKQGEDWGVVFGVKNLITGTAEVTKFSYEVEVSSPEEVKTNCRISDKEALSWIKAGRTSSIQIPPGETQYWIIRFQIPDTAPLCIIRYNVNVKANDNFYTADAFDIVIKA